MELPKGSYTHRLETFQREYVQAWEVSGKPDTATIEELFVDALDETSMPANAILDPLLQFFRLKIRAGLPLNWILTHTPQKQQRGRLLHLRMSGPVSSPLAVFRTLLQEFLPPDEPDPTSSHT